MKQNIRIAAQLACGLFAAVLTGCVKEHVQPQESMPRLQVVGVAVEETPGSEAGEYAAADLPQTRASEINDIFTFAHGDALSLFMRGTGYDDVDNRQVDYSKLASEAGTWAIAGSAIRLTDRTAVVSLVHPYTAGMTYNNIPFTTGTYTTSRDLLWKQETVSATNHEAHVAAMQHALARVKFVIKCDDPSVPDRFTGTGDVTSVSIDNGTADGTGPSAAVFTAGKLDLTAPASPVSGTTAGAITDNTAFSLSTTGHTTDLLTLPVGALAQDLVTLQITVDGVTLSKSLPYAAPANKWEAGKCYTYGITVKNKGIEVTSSTVDNWTDGTAGGSEVVKPIPPAAGDYYYTDGTTSTALDTNKTVEGVIFWVDPDNPKHFKIVALTEDKKQWSPDSFDIGTGAYSDLRADVYGETMTIYDKARQNGKDNCDLLRQWIADIGATSGKTIADLPAFQYCDQMEGGVTAGTCLR